MKEQEIDGLIVYSPYNLRYLANFTGTTGFALITLTDAYFVQMLVTHNKHNNKQKDSM